MFITIRWSFLRSHPPGNENSRGSNTIVLNENVKKSIKDALNANSSEETPIELASNFLLL